MLDLILELIPLVGLLQMSTYKLFKCNGHKMWGVRLFDEAETLKTEGCTELPEEGCNVEMHE